MLKKLFTAAVLLCIMAVSAVAQDEVENAKPRVFVEYFSNGNSVPGDIADQVRQRVIAGLANTQRFDLVDQSSESSMSLEEQRRQDEKAMADDKTRNQVLSAAGHDYIFGGSVLKYVINESVVEGKRRYTCTIGYSVSITEVVSSTTVASKTFEHTAMTLLFTAYDSVEAAVTASVNMVDNDMKDFLVSEFPLEGLFIPMDYEVKKDKLIACYIELGSDVGVKVDDHFALFVPSMRAGRTAYNEVAKLKVTEVVDGTLAYCKVTKNGKEAYAALNAFLNLDERTQAKHPIKVKSCLGFTMPF